MKTIIENYEKRRKEVKDECQSLRHQINAIESQAKTGTITYDEAKEMFKVVERQIRKLEEKVYS